MTSRDAARVPTPLSDRERIQELMAVYARGLDAKDYAAVARCFAPDAIAQYGGFSAELGGRDAIAAHMEKALAPLKATQHLFTNFIIENDAQTARLSCDVLAQHVARDVGEGMFFSGGTYAVELQNSVDGWRFSRLAARSVWDTGNREVLPRA